MFLFYGRQGHAAVHDSGTVGRFTTFLVGLVLSLGDRDDHPTLKHSQGHGCDCGWGRGWVNRAAQDTSPTVTRELAGFAAWCVAR